MEALALLGRERRGHAVIPPNTFVGYVCEGDLLEGRHAMFIHRDADLANTECCHLGRNGEVESTHRYIAVYTDNGAPDLSFRGEL